MRARQPQTTRRRVIRARRARRSGPWGDDSDGEGCTPGPPVGRAESRQRAWPRGRACGTPSCAPPGGRWPRRLASALLITSTLCATGGSGTRTLRGDRRRDGRAALGDPQAVLSVDDPGGLKNGTKAAGVAGSRGHLAEGLDATQGAVGLEPSAGPVCSAWDRHLTLALGPRRGAWSSVRTRRWRPRPTGASPPPHSPPAQAFATAAHTRFPRTGPDVRRLGWPVAWPQDPWWRQGSRGPPGVARLRPTRSP